MLHPLKCASATLLSTAMLGAMAFDGLTPCGTLKTRTSKEMEDSMFGVNVFYGTTDVELAGKAGFKFVRKDIYWKDVERKKGVYDFSALDRFAQELKAWNMKALFILSPEANSLHGGADFFKTQEGLDACAVFVSKVVERFKGRELAWEVLNEANYRIPPEDYMKILRAASKAIRQAQPNATICMTGTGNTDMPFIKKCLDAGAADLVDVIAFHPYRSLPERAEDNLRGLPSDDMDAVKSYADSMELLKRLVASYGGGRLKTWNTEHGMPSALPTIDATFCVGSSELMQAKYHLRRLALERSMGMERSVVFYIRDFDMNGVSARQGVLNTKGLVSIYGTPKQSYYAIRNLTAIFDSSVKPAPLSFEFGALDCGDASNDPSVIASFEAEDGTVSKDGGTLAAVADAKASGGRCLSTPDSKEPYEFRMKFGPRKDEPAGAGDGKGSVTFKFKTSGKTTAYVFGRVRSPFRLGASNSFFVKVDDGKEFIWDTPETGAAWRWSCVMPRNANGDFELEPGEHAITFRVREDGTELDAVRVATAVPKSVFIEAPMTACAFQAAGGSAVIAYWKAGEIIEWNSIPETKTSILVKGAKIKEPVLVDPLGKERNAFKLANFKIEGDSIRIWNLPASDYPLIIADASEVKLEPPPGTH